MWNLKHDTNELIYQTETDSQTQRRDVCVPRGSGWGRMNWSSGLAGANYYIQDG